MGPLPCLWLRGHLQVGMLARQGLPPDTTGSPFPSHVPCPSVLRRWGAHSFKAVVPQLNPAAWTSLPARPPQPAALRKSSPTRGRRKRCGVNDRHAPRARPCRRHLGACWRHEVLGADAAVPERRRCALAGPQGEPRPGAGTDHHARAGGQDPGRGTARHEGQYLACAARAHPKDSCVSSSQAHGSPVRDSSAFYARRALLGDTF